MDTLTNLNRKDNIAKIILRHIDLFESFNNIYLFGSLIEGNRYPNDIDLLLIYNQYSNEILFDLEKIYTVYDKLYEVTFDLTVLSQKEEEEIGFINRLESKYLKLK